MPVAGTASPAGALREYQTGNYTNALQEFAQLADSRTNDLRLVFDAGDAAYRATNFDLAQNLFRQATLAPDLMLATKGVLQFGQQSVSPGELKFEPDTEGLDAMEKPGNKRSKVMSARRN